MRLSLVEHLVISGNIIEGYGDSILIGGVSNSIIEGNTVINNQSGFFLSDFHHNKFVNNIVTGGNNGINFVRNNDDNNFKLNIICGNSFANVREFDGDESLDNNLRNNDFLSGNTDCP